MGGHWGSATPLHRPLVGGCGRGEGEGEGLGMWQCIRCFVFGVLNVSSSGPNCCKKILAISIKLDHPVDGLDVQL